MALARLLREEQALGAAGRARSAGSAAALLVRACVIGLHERLPGLLDLLSHHLDDDGDFASVVACGHALVTLWRAREPLGVREHPGVLHADAARLAGRAVPAARPGRCGPKMRKARKWGSCWRCANLAAPRAAPCSEEEAGLAFEAADLHRQLDSLARRADWRARHLRRGQRAAVSRWRVG